MSKGSNRRPTLVPPEQAGRNHEVIFGKRCIKHPQTKLIDGRCKRCDWLASEEANPHLWRKQ